MGRQGYAGEPAKGNRDIVDESCSVAHP